MHGAYQKEYDQLFVELIASNCLHFNLADSPAFHKFVNFLNKRINMKTSVTYSRQMVKYAKEVLEDIQKLVKELCDALGAITTDLWDSRTKDSYISGTIHFVDKLFRLHR